VRDYPSLITKLRFRSALVHDLSSICFLKFANFRLAHDSRGKDEKGRREENGCRNGDRLILGKCAESWTKLSLHLPSNVAILRTDSLFIHVFVLHEHSPVSACLLRVCGYISTRFVLGHAPTLPKRRVGRDKSVLDKLDRNVNIDSANGITSLL